MRVRILTPQEKLYEAEADEVILPGQDGELSVMDYHEPCLLCLRPGVLTVRERSILIKGGVVRVGVNSLTAMVEE